MAGAFALFSAAMLCQKNQRLKLNTLPNPADNTEEKAVQRGGFEKKILLKEVVEQVD